MPKISVIMPVYNTKEEYLREAIESVLAQTFTDFELIIVDDASTSNIDTTVHSYQDQRIQYYRLEVNQGAAAARNYALSKASGEYIAFMDSDDVSTPDRFEKQLAFFSQHPEIGCLGSQAKIIGDDKDNFIFPKIYGHEAIEAFLIFKGCAFCHSTVMLRKEILDKNNISYKNQYVPAEDYALWLDLVGNTKFAILKEKLLFYRFHHGNISHLQNERQKQSCSHAQFEAIKKYCGLKELDENALTKFYGNVLLSQKELNTLNQQLMIIVKKLKEKEESKYLNHYKKRFKKQYYKAHTFAGQLALWRSPLTKEFQISLPFRLFCLISRGIF